MAMITGPRCHSFGITGYGDPSHGVCIVGIGPGRDEIEKTKRPFTGNSGKLMDQLLITAGWHRDRTYATNTICWFNNKPSETEIEDCGERFRRELGSVNPKLIITAGAIANETVMGMKRRKGSRGSVVWSKRWKAYVLDTHHPSFALQSQSMDAVQDIIRDFTKIPRVLDWEPEGRNAFVHYSCVESIAEGQLVLDRLPRGRPVAIDIETSSIDLEVMDAYTDQLLCFSVSYDDDDGTEQTVVFPTRAIPQCVRDGSHVRSWHTRGACNDPNCPLGRLNPLSWPIDGVEWTFQNGQYDIVGINAYLGVRLPLKHDTMLMSACADERPGQHRLKENAREWIGAGWYEEEVKPFYKGKMNQLPPQKIEAYNAKDSAYTKRLFYIHGERMDEDDTRTLYENLLIPANDTFIDMQIRGINVDQRALKEIAYDAWFPRYLAMYRDLQLEAQEIGWPTDDINMNSSPQMQKLFFQIIGLEPSKFSKKTGKPSVDKEVLDSMDHPFAAKIRAYRTLDTMIDYVLAVMNNLKYDGLLHPNALVTPARTGRTSYRDPAMQTIPKDYTVGADYARLREIIIPHNPETHGLLEADYNQIEVWLGWAESKDPTLLEHLQSGDVHSATAEGAFKTKRDLHSPSEWDVLRQNAKKIRFGIQYGEGPEKLASPPPVGIGGKVADARVFINNFKATYPVYTAWMDTIQRRALNDGYLRTPSGRVMRFPVVMDHKQLRQAINFPIQSTASDYNLLSMIELVPLLRQYNSWVILNIHDCLVVEYDLRYYNEVAALVREVMQKPKFPDYPSIKVDMKIGPNLGMMKKAA